MTCHVLNRLAGKHHIAGMGGKTKQLFYTGRERLITGFFLFREGTGYKPAGFAKIPLFQH
jgi:hypothetical protein